MASLAGETWAYQRSVSSGSRGRSSRASPRMPGKKRPSGPGPPVGRLVQDQQPDAVDDGDVGGGALVPDDVTVRGHQVEGAHGVHLTGGLPADGRLLRRRRVALHMAAADERVGEQGVQLEVVPDAGEPQEVAGAARPVEGDERFAVQHEEGVGEGLQLRAGGPLHRPEQPQRLTPEADRPPHAGVVQHRDGGHLPLGKGPPADGRVEAGPLHGLRARLAAVRNGKRAATGRGPGVGEHQGLLQGPSQPGQHPRCAALRVRTAFDAGSDEHGDDGTRAGRHLLQHGGEPRPAVQQLRLPGLPEGLLQPDERLAGALGVLRGHRRLEVGDRSPETGFTEYHSGTLSTCVREP